jgi:hypothetical protein
MGKGDEFFGTVVFYAKTRQKTERHLQVSSGAGSAAIAVFSASLQCGARFGACMPESISDPNIKTIMNACDKGFSTRRTQTLPRHATRWRQRLEGHSKKHT